MAKKSHTEKHSLESTKDYDKFYFLESNRPIVKTHLKKMIDSLSKNNFTNLNPIIVSKDFRIIDGQHRFLACKELGIPFFYTMIDENHDSEIVKNMLVELNNVSRKWSTDNFISHYAFYGNEKYKKLLDTCKENDIPSYTVVGLVQKSTTKSIKSGEISIEWLESTVFKDYIKCVKLMLSNETTRPLLPRYFVQKTLFKFLLNDFLDIKRFIFNLERGCHLFLNCKNIIELSQVLCEVYNFRMRENKIYFSVIKLGSSNTKHTVKFHLEKKENTSNFDLDFMSNY